MKRFLIACALALSVLSPAFAADQTPLKNTNGHPGGFASGDTVGVAHGGTGLTTLTAHCVTIGAGTSAAHLVCPTMSGYVLTDNGAGSDPSFQAASGGGGTPGGSSGQVQYNNAGAFGGFTVSGDGTLVPSTGVLTVTKLNSISPGSFFSGTDAANLTGTLAAARIASASLSLAKIANAAANTRFLGSGSSGAGAAYAEQTISAGSGIAIAAAAGGITITATGASVPTTALSPPQGRLTLVTGVPFMTSDQTAKTHVYYTPYVGAVVPVYSGSDWALTTLSADLDMALDATNQPVNQLFDLFAWNGGVSIGAGPAWTTAATITVTIATPAVVSWTAHGLAEGAPVIFTTSGALPTGITAGTVYFVGRSPGTNSFNIATSVANAASGTFVATSGSQSGTHTGTNHTTSRGTGAGTTELQMLNGLWTNKNAITLTNGAGAGSSVGANQATYLGTFFTSAAGQTGVALTPAPAIGGGRGFIYVWNAYNRETVGCRVIDNASSWTIPNLFQARNNNTGNRCTVVDGLGMSPIAGSTGETVAGSQDTYLGIDFDSTSAIPPCTGQAGSVPNGENAVASCTYYPAMGMHFYQAVEGCNTGGSSCTAFGQGGLLSSPIAYLNISGAF